MYRPDPALPRCARCGSDDLEDKEVEKLIRSGDDVVALRVHATVCHHCGERYLSMDAVRALEQARRDLADGRRTHFRTLGQVLTPQPDPAG